MSAHATKTRIPFMTWFASLTSREATIERRRRRRVAADAEALLWYGNVTARAEIIDVSDQGMRVRCACSLPPFGLVSCQLAGPDSEQLALCILWRKGEEYGVGVVNTTRHPNSRACLDEFLQAC